MAKDGGQECRKPRPVKVRSHTFAGKIHVTRLASAGREASAQSMETYAVYCSLTTAAVGIYRRSLRDFPMERDHHP
jgi:hypothetical protein